jgi:carboxymethylenebutenolidase
MTNASGRMVDLEVSDGTAMRAYVVRPGNGATSRGLLLFQEAFGVNGHIRDLARRFAAEGYTVAAPEMFHRTAPGFEGSYDDFEQVRPHVTPLTVDGMVADAAAAHAWLTSEGGADPARTAAVGYCMGGRASFLANAALPLACAASYYGGGIAPALLGHAKTLHGPQLLCWGGKDTHIALEQRRAVGDALRQAGKPFVEVEFSEADHGFFCDQRKSYHAASARAAWALTLAFFGSNVS